MHAEFVKVSLPIHGTVYKVQCTTCLKTLGHFLVDLKHVVMILFKVCDTVPR